MDIQLTQLINSLTGQNAALDQIMAATTNIGVPFMILLAVLQWWGKRPREQKRHTCVAAGLSFLLGLVIAQIMLLFIHRLRPYDVGVSHLIVPATVDWSFPSDHAIASFAIVFAFALQGLRRWALIFLVIAGIVCFSRVYVGMHYVSDILGGVGVALIAAYLVEKFYRPDTKLDRWITSLL
jgi:undecaprenyl-diphosphatase